ncbi:MAG: cytidylate kinase [Pelagerythrobacter marensis]|nr:MAG: cytidylate kinase [Pelagerythrobacter marensis]
MIIAVDGPTASGKGTIAKALASHYGLPHLDTGLLYRAVGWQVAQQGGNPDDPADALAACEFPSALLAEPRLRDEATGGGAVLDGRDIGTVIAPEAEVKLFVTASVAARAERRWREMQQAGAGTTLDQIADDLRRRDARDRERAAAPLTAAPDAVLIDTSALGRAEAIAAAIEAVERIRHTS